MMDYPANYTIKKYKKRDLTDRQIAWCEAYMAGHSSRESYRIAGYKSEKNVNLLNCKRIKDYIESKQGRYTKVPVTFESKVSKLATIVDTTIPDKITKDNVALVDYGAGIKAISELNKMQGHYAPTQNQNLNVNVDVETKDASILFKQLLEQSTKDY